MPSRKAKRKAPPIVWFERIRGKEVHKPSFAHGRATAAADLLSGPTATLRRAEERVLKAAAAWAEDRLGKGEDHYITVSNELTLAVRARAALLKKWGQR